MERSLSALLPVRDVQTSLDRRVEELLEILPELTRRFELVIVDDGSRDATIEVADELVALYPQILVVRNCEPRGRAEAIATAFDQSVGEAVFLADENGHASLSQARLLWHALDEHSIVTACPAGDAGAGGLILGYRRALAPLTASMIDLATFSSHLERLGCPWHEIELNPRTSSRVAGPHKGVLPFPRQATVRADVSRPTSRPKRPNYLARLRDFALGE